VALAAALPRQLIRLWEFLPVINRQLISPWELLFAINGLGAVVNQMAATAGPLG
jgi:hypothetical protein